MTEAKPDHCPFCRSSDEAIIIADVVISVFTDAAKAEAQNCLSLLRRDGSIEYVDTCEER